MDPMPSSSKSDPEKVMPPERKECDIAELVKRLEKAAHTMIGEGEDTLQLSRDVADNGLRLADWFGVPFNKVDSLVSSIKAKAELEKRLTQMEAVDSRLTPPPLPSEILEQIFHLTQEDGDSEPEDLEWYSLVCQSWRKPAQRVLFSQNLILLNQKSIEQLRWTLDTCPDLAPVVRKLDLSNPLNEWSAKEVTQVFRRAAGLLRTVPCVKSLRLLHLQTSDTVRHKLWGALHTLDLTHADIQSSTWNRGGPRARSHAPDSPENSALCLALCHWNSLRSLTLSGYAHFPTTLSNVAPCHAFPSYQLEHLDLSCMDLTGSSLLWLIGKSQGLKRLGLASTTGISQDTLEALFEIVGTSLLELELSLDRIELLRTSSNDEIDSNIFRHLRGLETLILNSDHTFSRGLMGVIADLGKLKTLSLSIPVLRHVDLLNYLENHDLDSLEDLSVDTWDHLAVWTDYERWQISRLCDAKNIELLLNGLHKTPIELAWYGVGDGLDLSKYWAMLESPPKSETRTHRISKTKHTRRERRSESPEL